MSASRNRVLFQTRGTKKNTNYNSGCKNDQPVAGSQQTGLLQSLKRLLRIQSPANRRPATRYPRRRKMAAEAPSLPAETTSAKPQAQAQVYVVGSPNPKSPFLRIAHVSDTCSLADSGYSAIFEADVVVHSGNLVSPSQLRKLNPFRDSELAAQLRAINEFFAPLPHRFKIFVPGPNETFAEAEDRERIQALLPNCVYLHDSSCLIEGVTFHGVGCAAAGGRRFRRLSAEARTAWSNVPDNVDVLVSHSVPLNSLYEDLISRLRPKMVLYGSRMHRTSRADQPADENCVKFKDNVIFSNGHAGNSGCKRGLFDFYADDQAPRLTQLPTVSPEAVSQAFRSLHSRDEEASAGGGLLRCILS